MTVTAPITPIPYTTGSPEWHALRLKHIGASEVAALFDVQPAYALSRYALWHVKAGNAPPPDVKNERVFWGNRLENLVAEVTAEVEGWTIRKGGYAEDLWCPGLGASLDFEVAGNDRLEAAGYHGDGCLETKTVDWLQHRASWTGGEPPMHILLQLQAQCAARGFQWGAVAALVSGNDRQLYMYHARPKLIAEIRKRVADFWASIEEGDEPPPDGSDAASAVLRALYPVVADDSVDMTESNEWPEAVQGFIDASAVRKAAAENYEKAKNRVVALLGPHKRGWGNGYSVNVAITAAVEDRPARPGEIIRGRAETRRYTAKHTEVFG